MLMFRIAARASAPDAPLVPICKIVIFGLLSNESIAVIGSCSVGFYLLCSSAPCCKIPALSAILGTNCWPPPCHPPACRSVCVCKCPRRRSCCTGHNHSRQSILKKNYTSRILMGNVCRGCLMSGSRSNARSTLNS